MAEKRKLLGFRVPARFRRRIESECIKREMSFQDLVTNALKVYFQTPSGDWKKANVAFLTFDDDEKDDQQDWMQLWVNYMNKMPQEKTEVMARAMKFDLLQHKSSRRKKGLSSERGAGRGRTRK
jgi:hypothetical protein